MSYLIRIKPLSDTHPILSSQLIAIVEQDPAYELVGEDRGNGLQVRHLPSASTLTFINGEIWSTENPTEKLFAPMIDLADRLKGYIEDDLGRIKPEWYEYEWWDEDVRDQLLYLSQFQEQFGRDPEDQTEFASFIEAQLDAAFSQLPPGFTRVSSSDLKTEDDS